MKVILFLLVNFVSLQNLDTLLKNLTSLYDSLYNKIYDEKSPIIDLFTLEYFKELESSGKTENFTSIEINQFPTVYNRIIELMGISNKKHAYVLDIFNNQLHDHDEFFKWNEWINFDIITTVTKEKNIISYGTLYVSKEKEREKYNFIFFYGKGKFDKSFSGLNIAFLTSDQGNYIENSYSYNSGSEDFQDPNDEHNLILTFNLLGFKLLGNKYNINLPYPIF